MPAHQLDDRARPVTPPRLAMIGAGQMALALGSGFCRSGEIAPSTVRFFDPSPAACDRFLAAIPSSTLCPSAAAAVSHADLVFLAVKPQHAAEACRSLVASLDDNSTVVSVVAGLSIAQLSDWLGMPRIIRVMPNTPCLVGKGVLAVAHHPTLPQGPVLQTERLLASVGHVHRLSEGLLNAVTGLSGSGPGFVAIVAEALADGGVLAGLPRDLSLQLAIQTLAGTAALLESTGEHPAGLKDRVASPAGTTIAGIASLERSGLRAALIDAVKAAAERSAELASG
jgi:pyrroline-5-carboxylate reductase